MSLEKKPEKKKKPIILVRENRIEKDRNSEFREIALINRLS